MNNSIEERREDRLTDEGKIPHVGSDFNGEIRVRIDETLYNRIISVANQENRNISDTVRTLVQESLPMHEGTQRSSSGQSDTSHSLQTGSPKKPKRPE